VCLEFAENEVGVSSTLLQLFGISLLKGAPRAKQQILDVKKNHFFRVILLALTTAVLTLHPKGKHAKIFVPLFFVDQTAPRRDPRLPPCVALGSIHF